MKRAQINRQTLDLILGLRDTYGDMNVALVALYVRAFGRESTSKMARYLGVNRSVVRRAIDRLSDSDLSDSDTLS